MFYIIGSFDPYHNLRGYVLFISFSIGENRDRKSLSKLDMSTISARGLFADQEEEVERLNTFHHLICLEEKQTELHIMVKPW